MRATDWRARWCARAGSGRRPSRWWRSSETPQWSGLSCWAPGSRRPTWRLRRSIAACAHWAGQRLLGLSATLVDAAALFGVAASVGTGLVPSVYALFALVAGVAAVRYTPMKTTLASIGLSGALAGAMAVRSARDGTAFDVATFVFWGVLILLVGIGAGTAIREVYRQRVAAQSNPSALPQELTAALTPRERQVLSLIAEGYSNAGIAEALVIEHKTVKNHINRLYAKLELGGRYEAIARVVAGRAGYDDAAP